MKLSYIANTIFVTVVIALSVWVFASIWDVTSHNLDPNPVYQEWNLINVGDAS